METIPPVLPFAGSHMVPFDTDCELFSWFFDSIEFEQWHQSHRSWQLRCVGAPGSGKTTLSALVVRHLSQVFQNRANVGIASIFLKQQVLSPKDEFLEVLLESVLQQLSKQPSPNGGDQTVTGNDETKSESNEPHTEVTSAADIRDQLNTKLSQLERAFLILDDFDLCDRAVTLKVEAELSNLQKKGLSIMVTSRIPHRHYTKTVTCDIETDDAWHNSKRNFRPLYWCCRSCYGESESFETKPPILICKQCMDTDNTCRKCEEGSHMYEPYEYVDMTVNAHQSMDRFVAKELEHAHGDLDLETMDETYHPSSSALARSIRETRNSDDLDESDHGNELCETICDLADGNVAMAKLRLDNTLAMQTVDDIWQFGQQDRLPDNILAMFDTGIKRIEQLPTVEKWLGLRAIVAVARYQELTAFGIPFAQLEQWLHWEARLASEAEKVPHRKIEEVLHAAGGFLRKDLSPEARIQTYHDGFKTYVVDNYNETLFWTRSKSNRFGIIEQWARDSQRDPEEPVSAPKTSTTELAELKKMLRNPAIEKRPTIFAVKKAFQAEYADRSFMLRKRPTALI